MLRYPFCGQSPRKAQRSHSQLLFCIVDSARKSIADVDRRRSLRVVPSNKGEVLTGSRDDFIAQRRLAIVLALPKANPQYH